jgi:DNA-binding transcriptional regulator YiaG
MPRRTISPAQIRAIRGSDTQSEFAPRVGVSSGGIVARWEMGSRRPSPVFLAALERLAKARGVKLEVAGA